MQNICPKYLGHGKCGWETLELYAGRARTKQQPSGAGKLRPVQGNYIVIILCLTLIGTGRGGGAN